MDKPSDAVIATLAALLEGDDTVPLYAALDAAANDELIDRLYAEPDLTFECLIPGDVPPDVFYVAPFLVDLTGRKALLRWLLAGWRQSWGIYLLGRYDFEASYRHLRGFVRARDPQGASAYVRYYDPRVFPILGAHLSAVQLGEFFAGVSAVVCESAEGSQALRFAFENGALVRTELPLETRHVGP